MSTQDKDYRSVLVECQHRTKITGVLYFINKLTIEYTTM